MKKMMILVFISFTFLLHAETVFFEDPKLVNVHEKMKEIVKELQIAKIKTLGYTVDSLSENSDYQIRTKIIRFEDGRAYYTMQLMQNSELIFEVSKIITDGDKLDLFIERMLFSLMNQQDFKDSKIVGNVIVEEETLSDIKEPFKTSFALGIGAHLGTIESITPDYHYLPVFTNLSLYFTKPEYMFSIQSSNFFEGLGLRIGSYKITTKEVNALFYGGAVGVGVFWGPYYSTYVDYAGNTIQRTSTDPFLSPIVSASIGGLFNRTSTVVLKPELEISIEYRKSNTVQLITSANVYISLMF